MKSTYSRQDIQWGPYIQLPKRWEMFANQMAGSSKLMLAWSVRGRMFAVATWFSDRAVYGFRLVSETVKSMRRWLKPWRR